ncbi:FecR family protein [uncultured Butyricimonas sp.]|uniref:FecR family protein n=1 Tax=uncultured Butyricimonas sp. TaxID=1268785 RepID=UPI0026DBF608|nr:FecR domain-containing protein [uncultured Butyricimonas sp.]
MMEYPKDYKISRLIAKKMVGTILPAEEEKLEAWLKEDVRNGELFQCILEGKNVPDRDLYAGRFEVNESWELLKKQLVEQDKRRSIFPWWMGIAASMILLVGVGLYWGLFRKPMEREIAQPIAHIETGGSKAVLITSSGDEIVLQDSTKQLIALGSGMIAKNDGRQVSYEEIAGESGRDVLVYNTIRVPRGGEYKLFLSDSTEVFLNSDSEIRFPVKFGKNERDVFLRGEAFFIVRKDAARPFVVNADDKIAVEVLGTQFNLQAYPDKKIVETTLNEGLVRVYDEKQSVKIQPNQQVVYNGEGGQLVVRQVDASLYSAWKDGRFVLLNNTLEDIMNRLGRWYNIDIFWVNPELKEYHFSGELTRYEDFTEILDMLEKATRVHFEVKGRTVFVNKIFK